MSIETRVTNVAYGDSSTVASWMMEVLISSLLGSMMHGKGSPGKFTELRQTLYKARNFGFNDA